MIPELPIPFNTSIPFFVIPLIFGVITIILALIGLLAGFYFSAYFLAVEMLLVIIAAVTIGSVLNGGNNAISLALTESIDGLLEGLIAIPGDVNIGALISGLSEYVSFIFTELIYYVIFLIGGAIVATITYRFGWRLLLKKARLPKTINRIGGLFAGAIIGAGIGSYVILPFSYSSLVVGGETEEGESFTDNTQILQFLTETVGIRFPAIPSQGDLQLILGAATSFLDLGLNIQNVITESGANQNAFVDAFFTEQSSGNSLEEQLINSLVMVVDALSTDSNDLLSDIIIGVIETFGGSALEGIQIPEFIFQGVIRQVVELRSQSIPANIITTFRSVFVERAA